MKITRKDLMQWINKKTPIRYRSNIYHADYNGLYYMLRPTLLSDTNEIIKLYKTSRTTYGLETNRAN